MNRLLLAVFSLLVMLATPNARATSGDDAWVLRSPMAIEWERHSLLPFDRTPFHPTVLASTAAAKPPVTVLGYVTHWTLPNTTFHLDQMTVLAYFSAPMNPDGTLGETYHWNTSTMDELITQAHENGVKVVLTITNFSPAGISSILNENKATAIASIVDHVVAGGGDGANIDFEGLDKVDKVAFVTFVQDLKAALDDALGESHLTLATPAIDWPGAFDYDELAKACDGLVIMGYAYYWQGGPPGPNSPLVSSDLWGNYSLTWTVNDYLVWGTKDIDPSDTAALAERKKRFILALPLYGQDWPTTDSTLPGTSTSDATSPTIHSCLTDGADTVGNTVGDWQWDDHSQTPYKAYRAGDGTGPWHQRFCENSESLYLKYRLAADTGIGGVGFWALGYDRTSTEPWDQLALAFPPVEPMPDTAETVEAAEVAEALPDMAEDIPPLDVVETSPEVATPVDVSEAGPDMGSVDLVPVDITTPAQTESGAAGGGGGCSAGMASSPWGLLCLAGLWCLLVVARRRRGF